MEIIKTTNEQIEDLMNIRLEMLKEVNKLSDDYVYDKSFVDNCRNHFLNGNQTTVLVYDNSKPVACATLCYINVMPTFDHPTGNRAHLMNVYVNKNFRRKGLAKKMIDLLVDEAKEKGVTEISLDATEAGKPLYSNCGFTFNNSAMVLGIWECKKKAAKIE